MAYTGSVDNHNMLGFLLQKYYSWYIDVQVVSCSDNSFVCVDNHNMLGFLLQKYYSWYIDVQVEYEIKSYTSIKSLTRGRRKKYLWKLHFKW